jgi:hypothetical protein
MGFVEQIRAELRARKQQIIAAPRSAKHRDQFKREPAVFRRSQL